MREIKFRLILDNKIVGYEKWYAGKRNPQTGLWEAEDRWLYSKDGKYWNPQYIYHHKKDMYTGLKIRDKEVYEGDIIQLKWESGIDDNDNPKYETENILVYWDEDACNFLVQWSGFEYEKMAVGYAPDWWDNDENRIEFEVIGNIYENPELLKERKP